MNDSYIDLPYDLEGFSHAIDKFLIQDTLNDVNKIDFELPNEYKIIVLQYAKMQENFEMQENVNDTRICVYKCSVKNKYLTFFTSPKIIELKIKVFKPYDKKKNKVKINYR